MQRKAVIMNKEDFRDIVEKRLKSMTSAGDKIFDRRFAVKHLCITIWTGAFIFVFREDRLFFILPIIPVVFWYIEAMYAGTGRMYGEISE